MIPSPEGSATAVGGGRKWRAGLPGPVRAATPPRRLRPSGGAARVTRTAKKAGSTACRSALGIGRRRRVPTLALVWRRQPGPARWSAAVAVGAIAWGWAVAQRPELLPGLTLQESAAGHATLVALLGGIAVGTLILVPSLFLLFRLALSGRLGPDLGPPAAGEREIAP